MRKLIFAVTFMLLGLLSFASKESKNFQSILTIKNLQSTLIDKNLQSILIDEKSNSFYEYLGEKENFYACIHVTLSCGVEYDICNFTGTTEQLINVISNANNNVCGTNFPPYEP